MRERLALWAVLTLIVVLTAALGLAWSGGPKAWVPPSPHPPNPDSLLPVAPEVGSVEISSFAVQVLRPVFVPGRRPLAKDVADDKKEPPRPITDIVLIGIFASGTEQGAMVRTRDGSVRRVGLGESEDGFVLRRVDGDRAVFSDGSRDHVLQLRPAPRQSAVPPPMRESRPARPER